MSVKASLTKPSNPNKVIDVETAEGADQFARDLGITEVVSTGDGTGETTERQMAAPETQALVRQPARPAGLNVADSGGGLEGEFDRSDLKTPQLKIVNGSGELSQKFNQGSL